MTGERVSGGSQRPINNPRTKLPKLYTDDQVHAIRLLYSSGLSQNEIARRMSIPRVVVRDIVLGRTRVAAAGPISVPVGNEEREARRVAGTMAKFGKQPPKWTPEILSRLGVDPDVQIAREAGVTPGAVCQRRQQLGIPRAPRPGHEARTGPKRKTGGKDRSVTWTINVTPAMAAAIDALAKRSAATRDEIILGALKLAISKGDTK